VQGVVPALFVLAAAVLWGTTGTAQALGPDGVDPVVVGSGRIVLGGALLALYAGLTGAWRSQRSWPRRDLAVTAACVAAYQLCFFAGVARAGVAVGTLIAIGSAPVFTGLVATRAGAGRPSRAWMLATALAVAGCAALVLGGPGGAAGPVDLLGVTLALGAGLSYAGYTVGGKRLVSTMGSPTGAMAAIFGAGGVLLLPVLVVRLVTASGSGAGAGPGTLAVVAYLAVVPTALAYLLFGRGLAGLHPPVVATLSLTEPLVAAALGVSVLDEAVTPLRLVGAVLILAGLAASVRTATPAPDGADHELEPRHTPPRSC
jgi:DME family drug/metabolite transporter